MAFIDVLAKPWPPALQKEILSFCRACDVCCRFWRVKMVVILFLLVSKDDKEQFCKRLLDFFLYTDMVDLLTNWDEDKRTTPMPSMCGVFPYIYTKNQPSM